MLFFKNSSINFYRLILNETIYYANTQLCKLCALSLLIIISDRTHRSHHNWLHQSFKKEAHSFQVMVSSCTKVFMWRVSNCYVLYYPNTSHYDSIYQA